MRNFIVLFLIFVFAFILRVYNLDRMPLHLHQDEVMNGYVGRFILQNGVDLYGNRWPLLYFDNFGDYPNVIPMYISGLFTYVFGVTEFAVRFPIALVGALTIFPMYGIGTLVFKKERYAFVLAMLLAILPWHIVLSRATAETVLGSCLYLTGLYIALLGIKKHNHTVLLLSAIPFFCSYFLYATFRVVPPLAFLGIFFLAHGKKMKTACVLLIVLFFSMTIVIGRTHWGSARFKQTSIFTFNSQVNQKALHYTLGITKQEILPTRIFNNKLVLYSREIIKQYTTYFSPQYLFMEGGHPDRYLVPDQGLLYIGFLGLLLLTLFLHVFYPDQVASAKKEHNRNFQILLLYVTALAPLSSALTLDEVPNVHRSGFLGVMLIFAIGFAYQSIASIRIKRLPIIVLFWICIAGEFAYFWHQYMVHAKSAQAIARYDERTDLVKFILKHENDFDGIFLPREIFPIYYLFYTHNFDPSFAGKFTTNLYIPQIGKIYFINNDCPTSVEGLPSTDQSLIVDLMYCKQQPKYLMQTTVVRPNGTEAYRLLYQSTSKHAPIHYSP